MKQLKYILFFCFFIGQSLIAKTTNFEFLNRLDIPVDVALGTRKSPPTMQSPTKRVGAWDTYKEKIDADLFPQFLVKDPSAPGVAFVYEFRDKKDKDKPVTTNIYVRLLENNNKVISFERQQNTFGNLDKENIVLIKTLGTPQKTESKSITPYAILGLKDNASDAEILGISKDKLKDANAVRIAYVKLRIWHPDQMNINATAKARYAKDDVKNLSAKDKEALAKKVFKLIEDTAKKYTKLEVD